MWERYPESLTMQDIAASASLSMHYFSRLFRTVTGTSPGRFLAAIRLYEAKRLLRETTLSVTEISLLVGYNSLGTFTSRFTHSIGVTAVQYRRMGRSGTGSGITARPAPDDTGGMPAAVHGRVVMPQTRIPLRVFIGAFPSPVMAGQPASWDVLESAGGYRLPAATASGCLTDECCFVLAAAVPAHPHGERADRADWPLLVGTQPVRVVPGRSVRADLALAPPGPLNLPVLTALETLEIHRPRPTVNDRSSLDGPGSWLGAVGDLGVPVSVAGRSP